MNYFNQEDIIEAKKQGNLRKGLAPDFFTGEVLQLNETLRTKIAQEICVSMNSFLIP